MARLGVDRGQSTDSSDKDNTQKREHQRNHRESRIRRRDRCKFEYHMLKDENWKKEEEKTAAKEEKMMGYRCLHNFARTPVVKGDLRST